MTTHNRNTLIVGAIVIVLLILGFFAWQQRAATNASAPAATSSATTTGATSTTPTVIVSPNGQITAPAGYTINPVYATSSGVVAPNYKAPLTFSSDVSVDEQTQLQNEFSQVEAAIAASPKDFNSWIQLGIIRKEAGDYQGAAADWQYMSALYPTNLVSNANLADLYTNFLPNYPKAAAAYQAQIKNDPTDIYIYIDLYQLYTAQYPQSSAVITAMLKQGLAANPGNAQLEALLAKYQ